MANKTNLIQLIQKGKPVKLIKTMRKREKSCLSKTNNGFPQGDQRKTQHSYFALSLLGVHLEERDELHRKL